MPTHHSTFRKNETYEQWRQRMLDETARFIEWGLKHPEQIHWIPMAPVGKVRFSNRLKQAFYTLLLRDERGPD